MELSVEPESWFIEYAQHSRAPNNGIEYSARLTGYHEKMIEYAQRLLGENHTKVDIASLGVGYALDRPYLDWNVNAMQFERVSEVVVQRELDGEYIDWMSPVDTYWEPKVEGTPQKIRIGQGTDEMFTAIRRILQCSQSEFIRFCLALAFAWFDSDIFHGERASEARELFGKYVDVMREQLEYRTERASAELDAF
jgi:hypothetical protein